MNLPSAFLLLMQLCYSCLRIGLCCKAYEREAFRRARSAVADEIHALHGANAAEHFADVLLSPVERQLPGEHGILFTCVRHAVIQRRDGQEMVLV
eukprot:scaffold4850_cov213-Pinguiococcus_pyrenoidosus.AAC.21